MAKSLLTAIIFLYVVSSYALRFLSLEHHIGPTDEGVLGCYGNGGLVLHRGTVSSAPNINKKNFVIARGGISRRVEHRVKSVVSVASGRTFVCGAVQGDVRIGLTNHHAHACGR